MHQAEENGTIIEQSSDGRRASGSEMVDLAIEHFIVKLFGKMTFEQFKLKHTGDYFCLLRDLELKKLDCSRDINGFLTMKIPNTLTELSKKSLREVVEGSAVSDNVTVVGDKVQISDGIFKSFFDEATENVIRIIQECMEKDNLENIVVFGELAESCVPTEQAFPHVNVICVPEAIHKGAVLAGHGHKVVKPKGNFDYILTKCFMNCIAESITVYKM